MSLFELESTPEEIAAKAARQTAVTKKTDLVIALSAVSILFCCLGGIVATYIAYNAKQDALAGDLDAAERRVSIATGLMIAAYVVGVMAFLGNLTNPR